MPGTPSTVITLGYGSFGSVNLIPTLGYLGDPGIPEDPPTSAGLQFTLLRNVGHYTLSGQDKFKQHRQGEYGVTR